MIIQYEYSSLKYPLPSRKRPGNHIKNTIKDWLQNNFLNQFKAL
jgi:hypothetical protein